MNVARGLKKLGEPTGKTDHHWVEALGRHPVSIIPLPSGMRLIQWRSGTYLVQRVAALFDADRVFVTITQRHRC